MDPRKPLLPPRTVYHGTDAHFEQFDVSCSLGAHFGSCAAACQRMRDTGKHRIWYYPVEAEDGNGWMVREETRSSRPAFEHGPFDTMPEVESFIARAPQQREPLAFEIDIYRPLLLPDLGTWEFRGATRALAGVLPQIDFDQVTAAWNAGTEAGWEALKAQLELCGHDSIAYVNEAEDPGSLSWIVLRAERIHHRWRPPVQKAVNALDRAQAMRERTYA
jgi:hypothetical protein